MATALRTPLAARPWALSLWLAGLLLSLVLALQQHRANEQAAQQRFERMLDELSQRVQERFGLYEMGLRGARGAVMAAGPATLQRAAFAAYVQSRELEREFPGARGFGFIRRVSHGEEADFVARTRAQGQPEFRIHDLAPNPHERYVIQFVEPLASNRPAAGLDIASDALRRDAARQAALSGTPRLSAPITLMQAAQSARRGFLLLLPVYAPDADLRTPGARERATLGWVYAPLVVDAVLRGLEDHFDEMQIRLVDAAETEPFYRSDTDGRPTGIGLSAQRELRIMGRSWRLQAEARPALLAATQALSPLLPLAVGSLLSTLAALLLNLLLRQRQQGLAALGLLVDPPGMGMRGFLSSRLTLAAGLIWLTGLLSYLMLAQTDIRNRRAAELAARLQSQAQQLVQQREQHREARRKLMGFLSETPPILGLWRSLPSGIDPVDGSDRAHWRARLQQIFAAHLRTAPEVESLSLRFLGRPARDGVGVHRVNGQLLPQQGVPELTPAQEALEAQALRQPSAMPLTSAPVRSSVEGQPRWSYQALLPILSPQGGPVAVLAAQISLGQRLEGLRQSLPPPELLFVLDTEQNMLLAPSELTIPSPPGRPPQWSESFQSAPSRWADAAPALSAWVGPGGPLLLAQARYHPNGRADEASQLYRVALRQDQLDRELRAELLRRMRVPAALGPLALLLLYLAWRANAHQQRARAERLRLARVLDQSRDAFIGLDAEQRITSWNQGAQALFGWPAEAVRGHALVELLRADQPWPRLDEPARRFEARVRREQGDALDLAVDWTPLQGDGAAMVGSLTLRDISQERAVQRRVQQLNAELEQQVQARTADLGRERQRLANILEGTDVGTWEWNVQTGETRFNERWAEIIGYRLAELGPVSIETWTRQAHPDDLQRSGALLQQHFAGALPYYECEARMRHRDGHWVWVLDRGRVLSWTPEGRPEWMYGTHLDITALKAAQQQQQRTASLLEGVLRAATEFSIIATDTEGLITVFNPGAERLLGYRADEMLGRQTPACFHLPDEVAQRGAELRQLFGAPIEGFRVFVHVPELQGSELREWTYVRKDGGRVPVALAVTAMRDGEGHVIGYLGIAQDISERRRAEQALRQAKQVAEAANAAKSLFLANMSHEIRTPMNAVLGIAHLLQDSALDADQRGLLDKLQLAGRSLLAIINDVLDLAKIEAGELRLESLVVQPRQVLDEVRALVEPQAQAKGLRLHTELAADSPAAIRTDPQRLRQILLNLASNAVKFTAQGEVCLRLRLEPDAQEREWLCWEVQDSGIGIPPEAQAQLFRPFVQADASTTRRFGGTGLGLAIVRELSERLGGTVSLRSQPGQGSCFSVRLPLERADAQAAPAGGLRVLLVEDDAAQREALGSLCRALGWEVEALDSGQALLQRLAADRPAPDVLLLDWQLGSEPDGLAALQLQVERQGSQALPAVLVLSSQPPERVRAAPGARWADAVLHKPVQPSELFNAVNQTVVNHTGSLERVLQATRIDALDAAWLPGVRVLVVDDNELNREVAQRLLGREGAQVRTADSGAAALALLASAAPPPFDAVLMDVQMPGMDGLETTRRLRQLPGALGLPVLALTAGALEEERQRALAAGMDGFLTKPLEPAELVRSLRHRIESRRHQPLPAQGQPRAASTPDDWPEIAGIERARSVVLMAGQRGLFLRSLQRLLDQHAAPLLAWPAEPGLPPEWRSDPDGAHSLWLARLHKLRGSLGQLGATALHAEASAAEQALREHQLEAMAGHLRRLRLQLLALRQAAAPALQAQERASALNGPPPEGPAWQALLEQLRQSDLGALSGYPQFLPGLSQRLGAQTTETWVQQLSDLDFPAALQLLTDFGLAPPES